MATYNATHSGGGTVGHPASANKVYVLTSPVYDLTDYTNPTFTYHRWYGRRRH